MPQANKPATTPSLPGALSSRTDGGPASKQAIRGITGYDPSSDQTNEQFTDLQRQAPVSATPSPGATPAQVAQGIQPVPIDAPSQEPGTPVTDGAAAGPGAGTEALNLPAQQMNVGLQNALVLLNQLGDSASPQVAQIRDAIAAQLNNQSGKR